MKLVLDANVLLAALITNGACAELLDRCVLRHEIISSDVILADVDEHLRGKFKYSDEDAREAIDVLRSKSVIVTPNPLESPVCRGPDDDHILATAIAGQARCIVTGDKDLLVLERYQGVEIISPSAFADFESREVGP
jgi:putative PIN family toxin of toxin-antitoxin system